MAAISPFEYRRSDDPSGIKQQTEASEPKSADKRERLCVLKGKRRVGEESELISFFLSGAFDTWPQVSEMPIAI